MKLRSILLIIVFSLPAFGQSTAFTYQGNLKDSGIPANGTYNFEFALYDAPTGGLQIGGFQPVSNVAVVDGFFTVNIDFGVNPMPFPGAPRYLEIRVGNTLLSPRQPVGTTPYAMKSLSANAATSASNASALGGVAASQYVLTSDPRMTDARNPLPSSAYKAKNTACKIT